ncbi:Undecaprenyl-phosphate glucose phosphotransferase [Agrobacterium larrymoorei]|uniref:Undecaprenyl-phosphate glucose phosphotransferase n=1 Tax=Agrobacterium larrymoorei TaxID=160699 RepID=A0AAJ2BC38_9HYPH|nr:undecaprenyl-phosphate glucose phosphotransferase [Agrobacterium larrymoorei]MDR6102002.1 Undecaprenyl-phosphate glucose phosphotransferase [Agrobacterium larrymoorei]
MGDQERDGRNSDLDVVRLQLYQKAARKGDGGQPTLNPFARQIANQLRDTSHSPNMVIGQLRVFEFVGLSIISIALNGMEISGSWSAHLALVVACLFNAGLTALLLQLTDTYQLPSLRRPLAMAARIVGSFLTACGVTAGAMQMLLSEEGYSWAGFAWWVAAGSVFLLLERSIVGLVIRHWGRNGVMERRAVIVGGGQAARDLIRSLEQHDNDIRICGIFDDRTGARSPEIVAGYPKLGTFAELVEFARMTKLDMLIIALPTSAEARIMELLRTLWVLPVDIRIAAHANKLRFRPRSYSRDGSVPMLDVVDKPIRDWDGVAKRVFDILFSVIALLLLWPVMIGAAIAVKTTSKGPVFFKQKRHGFNNETINVWKFRSMYTEMSDPSAVKAVTKNDPRVTPVGRFLRKSSLDELPQLFNVLAGDLSLVGPRPHAVHAQTGDLKYTEVVEHYFARHKVKPGVTGWAQINGWRGEIDNSDKIKQRTAFDLYYIENWSLWLDLKILFLTPIRLLKSENAY